MADKKFVKGGEASRIVGVSQQTLRIYADEGKIKSIRTPGGTRLYDITGYVERGNNKDELKVCYCRVSSHGQKSDLERQVKYMELKYPGYEIIRDVGSGINFKRPGLRKIIDYAISGKLKKIVVSYKDRLCRIGYDLIEHILVQYSHTEIVIDHESPESINEEIANDILEIVTVYSAKISGMRRYKS